MEDEALKLAGDHRALANSSRHGTSERRDRYLGLSELGLASLDVVHLAGASLILTTKCKILISGRDG